MLVQAHKDLVSEVARLRESFAHVHSAMDQSVTERKQLLVSIDSVDKPLREVKYSLPWLDGQVEPLTKVQLSGKTSLLQAQAPSGPREKNHDVSSQRRTLGLYAAFAGGLTYRQDILKLRTWASR